MGQPATKDATDTATGAVCDTIIASKSPYEAKTLLCAEKSRRWINVVHTSLSGCCSNRQKWCDVFYLKYVRIPRYFSSSRDGCGAKFLIAHAFAYKSGGLIIAQHNEYMVIIYIKQFKPSCH